MDARAPFRPTSEATVSERADRPAVDVAIIAIKAEEYRAILDAVGDTWAPHYGQRRNYRIGTCPTPNGPKKVAVTRCLQQGNVFAHAAANELIEDLDAQFVMVVGIAGGIPTPDFTLGDVVVSTDIVDLTVEDTGTGTPKYSAKGLPLVNDASRIVEELPSIFREVVGPAIGSRPGFEGAHTTEHADWNKTIDEAFAHHNSKGRVVPIATPASIASSDRLVKDPEIVIGWRQVLKGVAAIEMEAAGVALACSRAGVPFLAVRGISDIVGWKRDEQWTEYACRSAAAAARILLGAGALRRHSRQAHPSSQTVALGRDLAAIVFADWISEIETALSLKDWVALSDDAVRELVAQDTVEGANRLWTKLKGAIWPVEKVPLKEAIVALVDAFSDFVRKYVGGAELRAGGTYGPDLSYKRVWNPDFEEFSEQQDVWSSECLWRLCLLVVRLNEFADAVRRDHDPTFYLTSGKFMLHDCLGVLADGKSAVFLPDLDLVTRLRNRAEEAGREFVRKKTNGEFRRTVPLPKLQGPSVAAPPKAAGKKRGRVSRRKK